MFLDPKNIKFKSFQLDKSQKGENYVMKSDVNGVVSWVETNYYRAGREYEHYIGEHFGGGIVVGVWRDGGNAGTYSVGVVERCLIMATQDITFELAYQNAFPPFDFTYSLENRVPWSDVQTSAGALSSILGGTNSGKIMAVSGFNYGMNTPVAYWYPLSEDFRISPAALWCDRYANPNLGTGRYFDWYLPAVYELTAMFSNVTIVNKVLEQLAIEKGVSLVPATGVTVGSNVNSPINYVSGDYWTSTEKNATTAYIVNSSLKILPYAKYPVENQFYPSPNLFKKARPFRTDTRRWNGLQWVKDRKNTGLVLIVYNTGALLTTDLVANITSVESTQGNTVTVITTYDALTVDLTVYDHIWDLNVSNGNLAPYSLLTTDVITKYTDYLRQGGAMFLLGENSGFPERGASIASFITGLGGGTVTYDTIFAFANTPCIVVPEFLLQNNTNTVTFNAVGRFSNFGTGTTMVTLNATLPSNPAGAGPNYQPGTPGMAVFWKTGSLANVPSGALAVVLDINFLSTEFSGTSVDFANNLAQVLNKS